MFLANATTGMMIAYHDGSLFEKITEALGSNETIMNLFKSNLKIEHYADKNIKNLLEAILREFKNIRGRWFVNKIPGQKENTSTYTTRETVLAKKEIAQATADTRLACQEKLLQNLYKTAENNIDGVDYDSADSELES